VVSDRRELVDWVDATGRHRQAELPLIVFGAGATADHPGLAPVFPTIPAQES
jgi:hypothetical protein